MWAFHPGGTLVDNPMAELLAASSLRAPSADESEADSM